MAKSIRSKWKRKCRAIKRERYAVKELARLKKMLGIKEEQKPEGEVMETEQVIYLDAGQIGKKKKKAKPPPDVEEEVVMSSDDENIEVSGEDGEKKVYNTKTLKDQNGIITVHVPSITAWFDRSDVGELIVEILESDKFDLLADRIADRAVEKMKGLHNVTIARMGKEENDDQLNGEANRTDERSPFNNLKLKYKRFIKNSPSNNVSEEMRKRKTKKSAKETIKKELKKNKSKVKKFNVTDESDENENSAVKNVIDDGVDGRDGGGKDGTGDDADDNWEKSSSRNTEEVKVESSKKSFVNKGENKLKRKKGRESVKSKRSKRILRKENDRVYYLASSSDYDPYKDKIYDTLHV